jgi:hypothetical protein
MTEEERIKLLNEVIKERFGDWATRKDAEIKKIKKHKDTISTWVHLLTKRHVVIATLGSLTKHKLIWRNQRWHIVSAVLFGKSVNL